jgi:hypothetical protein
MTETPPWRRQLANSHRLNLSINAMLASRLSKASTSHGGIVMRSRYLVIAFAFFFVPAQAQEKVVSNRNAVDIAAVDEEERLTLTPSRLVAPIGSDVILTAAVKHSKSRAPVAFEWFLSNSSKGHFVQVGALQSEESKKSTMTGVISNSYAKGIASDKEFTITRGTASESDDVPVKSGESWVSLTSLEEGVTQVTCMCPNIENWEHRKLAATIYWIDVQWLFPEPLEVEKGQSVILETRLSRVSDFQPRKNWLVRYECKSGAPIAFPAAEGDSIAEVITDEEGFATVEASITNSDEPETEIAIQVIMPATDVNPRLLLGEGTTKIRWKKKSPASK